jgi:DNA-binding IclR family transcriptional regulator
MDNENSIQAVDRALQMLLAFQAGRTQLSVSDFAGLLGVHKSTASRLAATLVRRGFLTQEPSTKAFRLGPELGRLGLLVEGARDLIALSQDVMERLAQQTGETVNLAVLDGDEVVNIAQADGPHIVGVGNWAGRRTKAHCTSNGKVLLAFSGAKVHGPLEAPTRQTITSVTELQAHLEKVRRKGWATNIGELEEGLHSVGAPIFDGGRRCVAALTVAGPSYRVPTARLPELAQLCRNAADEVSARLGAPTQPRPKLRKA